MKKFLLSIALCGLASSAFAQEGLMDFNENFALTYNGETVTNDATLKATKYEDVSDLYGDGTITYTLDINVENLGFMPQNMRGVLKAYQPTMKEYLANRFFWGDPQLCYTDGNSGGCLSGDPNNLFNPNFSNGICTVPLTDGFEWQLHVVGCDASSNGVYLLTLQGVELEDPNNTSSYYPITTPFNIYLDFSAAASGVDEISADDQQGVYYDLQGRPVANPSKGLYIYKTADKAVKRLLK